MAVLTSPEVRDEVTVARHPQFHPKVIVIFGFLNGTSIAALVVAIVHSGLSAFAQALIIALVSALIGMFGMVLSAIISARATTQVMDRQDKNESDLRDLKRAIGASQRETD